jgi:hypothetical protein
MNFSNQYLKRKSRENIVGVKIRLRAGSIPGKEKNIFFIPKSLDRLLVPPNLLPKRNQWLFPRR